MVFLSDVFFGTKIYPIFFFLSTKMDSTKCNKRAAKRKKKKLKLLLMILDNSLRPMGLIMMKKQ